MREEILRNIDHPERLEKLYRADKQAFKRSFNLLYPEISAHAAGKFWNERLNYTHPEISWGSKSELYLVIIGALICGTIAKIPDFFDLDPELFYPRNIGFIIFPMLAAYFIWKHKLNLPKISVIFGVMLAVVIFINSIPADLNSDTWILSCIHLPIILWLMLGLAFVSDVKSLERRMDFLRFNGDLMVLTTVIGIAGVLLTGVTVGLFSLIGLEISEFYMKWIGIYGAAAAPVVATFIIQTNPNLINKVSPLVAKLFSPLVLVTLLVYLAFIFISGKTPYNDRDFLIIFNLLLIGVMALILFSVAETLPDKNNRLSGFILLLLSMVTVVVNGIALSAILIRINQGITPNRLAVTGGNVLILMNLLIVVFYLLKEVNKGSGYHQAIRSIARFLPVYGIWSAIVTFLFPFIFGFK